MNRQKKRAKEKELRSQTQNLEEMKPHKQTAFITVQRSTDFIENVLREWECATFILQTITTAVKCKRQRRQANKTRDEIKKSHEIDSLFLFILSKLNELCDLSENTRTINSSGHSQNFVSADNV